ncbi:hypothetical protein GCM10027290_07500 [Micromonospora sonneratiae]
MQRETQHDLLTDPEQRVDRAVRDDRAYRMGTPSGELGRYESGDDIRADVDLVGMHPHVTIFTLGRPAGHRIIRATGSPDY